MSSLTRTLRNRLLPAVLTAGGVTLIAAGVLNYQGNAAVPGPTPSAEPTVVSADPGSSVALPTLPPVASASVPSVPPASIPSDRVATRVVVEALGIDLPVVKPRGGASSYPECDVAMYIQELSQPGNGRATYLYAHARDGMFGPIYERAILKRSGGAKSMIGMVVQVYTSDDYVYEYAITEVRLHQLTLDDAIRATSEEMWLQTSEGPKGTPGKTQVLALPLAVLTADHVAAHPKARPVACG
ncbi:MAG TPA: sortase [Methylomirabilota bacterium]|nr:sortase [Methylomirabilota bacterium]